VRRDLVEASAAAGERQQCFEAEVDVDAADLSLAPDRVVAAAVAALDDVSSTSVATPRCQNVCT
jgi:hypothetical protein